MTAVHDLREPAEPSPWRYVASGPWAPFAVFLLGGVLLVALAVACG